MIAVISLLVEPGGMTLGQRMMQGTRIPPLKVGPFPVAQHPGTAVTVHVELRTVIGGEDNEWYDQ